MSPTRITGQSENVKKRMRAAGDERIERLQAEMVWVQKSGWLLDDHKLLLRPRFREDWTPSWQQPGNEDVDPRSCEDYMTLPPPPVIIDAYQLHPEGPSRPVCIKRVHTSSSELSIIKKLEKLRGDPMNHCVPVFRTFLDKTDENISYIVMPLLRAVDDPPFETVNQVTDFITQMMEGLYFMHSNNIAHRDCEYNNIMMDAGSLFKEPWHPQKTDYDYTMSYEIQPRSRSQANVKYYFIDFGLSVDVPEPINKNKYVLGVFGRDSTVPELSRTKPYDAFMVDIYIMGNMFRRILYNKYSNLEFLRPLIEKMTATNPEERPVAAEAKLWWMHHRDSLGAQSSDPLLPRAVPLAAPQPTWDAEPEQEQGPGFFGFTVLLGRSIGRAVYRWLGDLQG